MRIVDGVLKEYAWGRIDGLTPWIRPTGGPQAELWFGAHPSGASPIVGEDSRTLGDVAALHDLPMVKILAAALPLSIQIHPDAAQAEAGFAAQQVDPHSPPLFADAAEKTEMLIALTDFDTYAGWRDPQEAAAVLAQAGAPIALVRTVEHGTRAEAVQALLHLDDVTREGILAQLTSALIAQRWSPDAITALSAVLTAFPGDPGGLITVLLQHHRLSPGQGLAVPAGVVHSYVRGLAVEVMTSSDNVLRLGLTSKRIAVDEAVRAIRTDRAPILLDEPGQTGNAHLPFAVTMIIGPDRIEAPAGAMRTVVNLDAAVVIGDVEVPPGRAAVWESDEPDAVIDVRDGRAVLVRSSRVLSP